MSAMERSHGDERALGGRLTDARLLQTWGAAVTGGWVVSQVVAVAGSANTGTLLGLTAFWLVGSLVPISVSLLWMRARSFTGLFAVWTALGVAGLLVSFAVVGRLVTVPLVMVFGGLWFAGPAVGFLVTAAYMSDWSRWLYAGAAVANLAGAFVVVSMPGLRTGYFLVAAVVQGLPMLYHGVRLDESG